MARQSPNDFDKDDVIFLDREDGSSALIHLHGGTPISWKCKTKENLYMSSKAIFDNKAAIKGGSCISFPHFGEWSEGPMHGFARNRRWSVVSGPEKNEDGDVVASIQFEDDDETRAIWNNKFRIVYSFVLKTDSLSWEVNYHNTDTKSWEFTSCFHTFFRVAHVASTTLKGLKGLRYRRLDIKTLEEKEETEDIVKIDGYIARAYKDVLNPVTITSGPEPARTVELETTNFANIVLWNPWIELSKDFPDLDTGGYKEFICVEAGNVLQPVSVEPEASFTCNQTFKSIR